MATNSKKGSRIGAVKERSQVFNSSTGHYVKRDTCTGKFLEVKSDGKPFKGVMREAITIRSNPSVKIEIAKRSEDAVIKLRNRNNNKK
jgi:hypothetical protein